MGKTNVFSRLQIFWMVLIFSFGCRDHSSEISFNRDIRPILNEKCLKCHGGVHAEAGLSFLFQEDAFKLTESGKMPIVPGKPFESELVRRIKEEDPDERMPQESDPLSPAEIEKIERWIHQGAEWETHWAYMPPTRPDIPSTNSSWKKNDIDAFIWHRLKRMGLRPNGEAAPSVLLRRVALDLTGLPPEEDLAVKYLSNPSEDQYEALVDTLLSSPHFGERWAALWLDLARYADSQGYEKDPNRTMWKYRDWIISAFNRNVPFDSFTIEQLAGDLIPQADVDQLIATAFHRNAMNNTEGGTEDEEFRCASVIDRVNTTFDIWQATTIGCVQCHSHPYYPFRHNEYYKLSAYFNNTQDADLNNEFPYMSFPNKVDSAAIQDIIRYLQGTDSKWEGNAAFVNSSRLKEVLFPRLIPDYCDDFHNMLIYSDGTMANWSNNVNNHKDKEYYFLHGDIDISGLQQIQFWYASAGSDAAIKVYLDSIKGDVICVANFKDSKGLRGAEYQGENKFRKTGFPVKTSTGRHDLIFEVINTTGAIPDGIVSIKEIILDYGKTPNAFTVKLQDSLLKMHRRSVEVPIMKERSEQLRRKTYVFERGNYLLKEKEVKAGIPGILMNKSSDYPADRLGLAEWLVSGENPLTARVMANRIWEQFFGVGIVETLEDFGTQGANPTHPDLLDHLAIRFQEDLNWDLKRLIKEIVLSATYRQSSKMTEDKLENDPYNRYYSRGPRFRLSAEQIRDQALAVSGLINREIGGPSAMPPQPEGIWQVVYNDNKWVDAKGPDRFRRAIYTFWKRTTPYPSMLVFDSPSREVCISRRIRTNTPLQALVTLNDPVYIETARGLASRMNNVRGTGEDKISKGFWYLLFRDPEQTELNALMKLYDEAEKEFRDKPHSKPVKLDDPGEEVLDPMTVIANALLNLDEVITKN